MKVNNERCKSLEDALNEEGSYSFNSFCQENGLYSQLDRKRVDGMFIICPFHRDKNPSLLITESSRRWKCFACGAGSRYVDFVVRYRTEVLGLQQSKAQILNTILAKDRKLQERLGFQSIYQTEFTKSADMSKMQKMEFRKFKIRSEAKMGYLELATWMLKNKCSQQEMLYAVALMQSGVAPDVIRTERATVKSYLSVEELEDEYSDRDNL